MNPPKGIDPKVWEMEEPPKSTYPIKMHGAVLRGIESAGTPGDILTVNGAPFYSQEYLDKAVEAEREECASTTARPHHRRPFREATERHLIQQTT